MNIEEQVIERTVQARRQLHRIPEIGYAEFKTQAFIVEYLKNLGFQPFAVASTGVACYIDFGFDSTVAFRADIDALPVGEETGCDFPSEHQGFMHACGHDGHMAILLGFADWLANCSPQAKANVLLVFQPAEEGPGGALRIIDEGLLDSYRVSRVYGLHLSPEYPFGCLASRPGEFLAGSAELYFNVIGASSHGAKRYLGRDALLACCELTLALHTLIPRIATPFEDVAMNLGLLRAGDRLNVVAGNAELQGTLRTYSEELRDRFLAAMGATAQGIAISHGVGVEFNPIIFYPPLINDEALYGEAQERFGDLLLAHKEMISEDFAYYGRRVPSLFFMLGIDDGQEAHRFPLHSSHFAYDDAVLAYGVGAWASLISR